MSNYKILSELVQKISASPWKIVPQGSAVSIVDSVGTVLAIYPKTSPRSAADAKFIVEARNKLPLIMSELAAAAKADVNLNKKATIAAEKLAKVVAPKVATMYKRIGHFQAAIRQLKATLKRNGQITRSDLNALDNL